MSRTWKLLALVPVATAAACGGDDAPPAQTDAPLSTPPDAAAPAADEGLAANAVLRNRQGQDIGTVEFRQEGNAVVMVVNARNLEGGERAIHIHGAGVCEAPTFETAGAHFNPESRSHGFDHPEGPHAGDLRNLVIDPDDGIAHETFRLETVTLRPGQPNSLVDGAGTTVVIHAGADDYVSQPAGDSGDRIACGVITGA